jgi:hypothetical protein
MEIGEAAADLRARRAAAGCARRAVLAAAGRQEVGVLTARGWVVVVAGVGGARGCGDPRPSLLLAADAVGAVWVAASSIWAYDGLGGSCPARLLLALPVPEVMAAEPSGSRGRMDWWCVVAAGLGGGGAATSCGWCSCQHGAERGCRLRGGILRVVWCY